MRPLQNAGLLCLALSLTPLVSCTTPEPVPVVKIQYEKQQVPAALLDCGQEPEKPQSDAVSIAIWTTEHVIWGRKCNNRLQQVKKLVTVQ